MAQGRRYLRKALADDATVSRARRFAGGPFLYVNLGVQELIQDFAAFEDALSHGALKLEARLLQDARRRRVV